MDLSEAELVLTTIYAPAIDPSTGMLILTATSSNVELRPKTPTPATARRRVQPPPA
jgi:hypothetical protein